MNQENNGQTELEEGVFEKRWKEIGQSIDEYLIKIKAKSTSRQSMVEEIINMPYDNLKRLSHEECGEYAFILGQYAYFLQQEHNYHQSKLDWAESTLTYISANYGEERVRTSTFVTRENKIALLSSSNKEIKSLHKMMTIAKTMTTTLNSLSYRINTLIDSLHQIQQSKRSIRNG